MQSLRDHIPATLLLLHPLEHKRSWSPTISRKSLEEICPMFSFPHPDTSLLLTFCWHELGYLTAAGLENVVQLRGLESESVCCLVMSNSLDPMNCSPPGSSVHEILQARILEWVAMPSSRGSSQPRDGTWVSCIAGRFHIIWATSPKRPGLNHNSIFMTEGEDGFGGAISLASLITPPDIIVVIQVTKLN